MPLQQTLPDPLRSLIFYLFTQSPFQLPHCPPLCPVTLPLGYSRCFACRYIEPDDIPAFIHTHHDAYLMTDWCRSLKAYHPFLQRNVEKCKLWDTVYTVVFSWRTRLKLGLFLKTHLFLAFSYPALPLPFPSNALLSLYCVCFWRIPPKTITTFSLSI